MRKSSENDQMPPRGAVVADWKVPDYVECSSWVLSAPIAKTSLTAILVGASNFSLFAISGAFCPPLTAVMDADDARYLRPVVDTSGGYGVTAKEFQASRRGWNLKRNRVM